MRNISIRETLWVSEAVRSLAALLPAVWRLDSGPARPEEGKRGDEVVALIGPDGTGVRFILEAWRSGTPTGLLLATLREKAMASSLPLLFVSDYIGPGLREALVSEGISYVDATGWVRITSDVPLILLTGEGAAKSPRSGKSAAVVRLNGVAANRIICTLCADELPLGVRDLASIADVSPGSVSKLLPTLVREGLVDRDVRGAVVATRRRALIRRWTRDYSYPKSNGSVGYFITPRGLDRTLGRLADLSVPVTVTGSAAARRLLPEGTTSVVPLRLLALYTTDPKVLADELGLVPAEPATANTVVAVPQNGAVLTDRSAPVGLVLADLLTLPGRGDAEAEQLMDTFARTDQAWEA